MKMLRFVLLYCMVILVIYWLVSSALPIAERRKEFLSSPQVDPFQDTSIVNIGKIP
jgi:hypothetical protein